MLFVLHFTVARLLMLPTTPPYPNRGYGALMSEWERASVSHSSRYWFLLALWVGELG